MDVGKILSGSQLLQRSENIEAISATSGERTNAEGENSETNGEKSIEREKVTGEQVKSMTEALNKFLEPTKTSLKFQYHEKLDEYYVSIINPTTHEVIKEIPPKKLLDIYAAMAEFMGIIVDKKI